MRYTLTIDTSADDTDDGDAVRDVADIVRAAADRIERGTIGCGDRAPLKDTNGNTVGHIECFRPLASDVADALRGNPWG